MTTEQKAKAYDEAIERANSLLSNNQVGNAWIYKLLPELKESDDERIRKWLIEVVEEIRKSNPTNAEHNDMCSEAIAFLEKQGEQKPTYKVEPKFHVGDWVVFKDKHESIYQVEKIEGGYYILRHTYGGTFRVCVLHDEDLRLWTINDAKDGDVLANKYGAIFINAGSSKVGGTLDCYCYLSVQNKFCIEKHKTGSWFYKDEIKPATKKQRDLLFQKMKEAGYEWDAEKKELKKIEDEEYNGEDYGIDSLYHAQRILEKTLGKVDGYQSDDGILEHKCAITAIKKLYEQKPAWSEEDENRINRLIAYFEDKESFTAEDDIVYANWLKSLRPQNRWKPSEEQIIALRWVLNNVPYNKHKEEISGLLDQIKEL